MGLLERLWIQQNALVAWMVDEKPWIMEREIIRKYGTILPLNYKHNESNQFASWLHKQRTELRKQTRNAK